MKLEPETPDDVTIGAFLIAIGILIVWGVLLCLLCEAIYYALV